MKYKTFLLCLILTGCAELPIRDTNASPDDNPPLKSLVTPKENDRYYGKELIKNVNHYAKWLTQDLFANIDFPNNNDIFAVTNFALLDSDLNKTNHFGRQMTEAMIHEVHRTGFSVIDLKASGFIRMTEKGDVFYETTDYLEVSQNIDASHIITGTLTKHQGGYIVNAKVILLENKVLVSSAQIFVPYNVIEAVILEDKNQRVEESVQEAVTNSKSSPKKPTVKLKPYSK